MTRGQEGRVNKRVSWKGRYYKTLTSVHGTWSSNGPGPHLVQKMGELFLLEKEKRNLLETFTGEKYCLFQ